MLLGTFRILYFQTAYALVKFNVHPTHSSLWLVIIIQDILFTSLCETMIKNGNAPLLLTFKVLSVKGYEYFG